jgi:site-specific DNA-methyltransferase (adenine-specific)
MFERIENGVKQIQLAQQIIAEAMDVAAIEALIQVFAMMTHAEVDVELNSNLEASIKSALQAAKFDELDSLEKRQVIQLVLVATMKADQLQANYQLTPDAIGLWITFVLTQFLQKGTKAKVLELGLGTGNLSATVMQALVAQNVAVEITGVDNDDTMMTVASGVMSLLDLPADLVFGDVMVTDLQTGFDVVIGDLPVGLYPGEVEETFQTKAQNGELTYVHHLLVERGMRLARDGGLGIFVVPAGLFESEQASNFLSFLQNGDVYLQGLLRLPGKMFVNGSPAKGILLLQKRGSDAKQAEPVMLAQLPELSSQSKNDDVVAELVAWMTANGITH